MAKILYNACYGGFSLSPAAVKRYAEIKGITLYPEPVLGFGGTFEMYHWWTVSPEERAQHALNETAWRQAGQKERVASNRYSSEHQIDNRSIDRADPVWVQVVEELGAEADGAFANIQIAEVSAGTRYRIDEYDGMESVMTVDDYEWSVAP